MASPQKEDGHVDIANEIMEALARTRIPGEARQVLDFILRKTYGWHKKEDSISLSQFEKATGLKRSNVCSSLKRLIEMNIIFKGSMERDTTSPQRDTTPIQVYGFQKDFEEWGVVPKKIPSPQRDTGVVPKRIIGGSPKRYIQKKTIQKKTNKRNILSDEEWTTKIKELYSWVNWEDVNREMDAWLLNNPKREKTRGFITNWLKGKQKDKPMSKSSSAGKTFEAGDLWL